MFNLNHTCIRGTSHIINIHHNCLQDQTITNWLTFLLLTEVEEENGAHLQFLIKYSY